MNTERRIAQVLREHLPDRAYETGCRLACGYDGSDLDQHLAANIAAALASQRRWWVTRNRAHDKVLGPFDTSEEAIRNRVRLEEYSGDTTFWVWEAPS
jgi:hypothetical protein